MKILYIHQYFNTLDSIGGTRSYEFSRRFVNKGNIVNIITTDRNTNDKRYSGWKIRNIDGIFVHSIFIPYSNEMSYFQRVMAFIKFLLLSIPYILKIEADIVFSTSTPLTVGIPGIIIKKIKKIPFIFEVRDMWPDIPIVIGAIRNPLMKRVLISLEKKIYKTADIIIALSIDMKKQIVKKGVSKEKIKVITNSADLELFNKSLFLHSRFRSTYDWLQNRPLVIYCGALGKINGLDYFIRLAEVTIAVDDDIRFIIIGEGLEKENLLKGALNRKVLNKNLFFLEPVNKREIAEIFCTAQLSLSIVSNIPELWANSANKFFDTLAAGIPIGINYLGWQADVIEKEKVGLLLDPNSPFEAAVLLVKHLRDKKWLDETGARARALAERDYSRDKLFNTLEYIFIDILKGKNR